MRNLIAPVMLLALVACSSAPVDVNFYLLRADAGTTSRELDPLPGYGLGVVELAPYINQRGLLLETADREIRPARFHQWAEPLSESLPLYLAQEISAASGRDLLPLGPSGDRDRIGVNIRIEQFHGTRGGGAILVAQWWLSEAGEVSAGYRFAREVSLKSDGYAGLVRAQEALLEMLAEDVAAKLTPRGEAAASAASAPRPGLFLARLLPEQPSH